MSQALENFFPYVAPWAPGVSDLAMAGAVRRAAQEFCRGSMAWRMWAENLDIAANTLIVPIAAPDSGIVIGINGCQYQNVDLREDSPEARSDLGLTLASVAAAPLIYGRQVDATGTVQLALLPLCSAPIADKIRARVTLMPADTAVVLTELLYEMFATTIGRGAAWILRSTSNTPDAASMENMEVFVAGTKSARDWANKTLSEL